MRGLNPSTILMRTAPTTKREKVNGATVFILDTSLLPSLWKGIGTSNLPLIAAATLR
jgi:hypothetical protein